MAERPFGAILTLFLNRILLNKIENKGLGLGFRGLGFRGLGFGGLGFGLGTCTKAEPSRRGAKRNATCRMLKVHTFDPTSRSLLEFAAEVLRMEVIPQDTAVQLVREAL